MGKTLIIIGGSGQAKVILDTIDLLSYEQILIEDPWAKTSHLLGFPVHSLVDVKQYANVEFVIAVGDNYRRWEISRNLFDRCERPKFATLIHPKANVSKFSKIDMGAIVCSGAFVGPNAHIGKHVILNSNSSTDHDCIIEPFGSLGPKATLGGNATIGFRSAICISATVLHGIKVAQDVVVGASSLVNKDIENRNSVWYGVPAKMRRERVSNEKYL